MRRILPIVVGFCALTTSLHATQVSQPPLQPGQRPAPPAAATGVIIGVVVDAATGRPVPGAIVGVGLPPTIDTLQGPLPPQAQRQFIATTTGRFVVTAVPAGPVAISATAPGYLPGGHGQRRPGGSSRAVVMEDGQREGPITIQLWKPAAMEGRLLDEVGEPIVRAQVRGLRRSWVGGKANFASNASTTTDDRGFFRLSGLTPGAWVVATTSAHETMPVSVTDEYRRVTAQGGTAAQDFRNAMSTSGGPSLGLGGERVGSFVMSSSNGQSGVRLDEDGRGVLVYPPSYYPAVSTDGIEVVTLASGEERTGIELQAVPTRTVSISGQLIGPDGPAVRTGVRLVPLPFVGVMPEQNFETARTLTDANGAFTFLGVPAGDYAVKANVTPRPNMSGATTIVTSAGGGMTITSMSAPTTLPDTPVDPTLWAVDRVSVGTRDLAGITLTLRVGPKVSGTVEFVGSATPPTPEQLQRAGVTLRPLDGEQNPFMAAGRLDAEGRFKTMGYPAGRYVLTVTAPGPGWFLQSAMLGGRDVSIDPLTLDAADVDGIVLTFTDRRTEISGAVIPASGGDTDGIVIAFPSDLRAWAAGGMNPRRVSGARANSAGRYTITGLPAGDYLIAGLPNDVEIETGNPAFFEALVTHATPLALSHGERRSMDVRIVAPRDDDEVEGDVEQGSGPFVPEQQSRPAPSRDAVLAPNVGTGSISGVVTLDDDAKTPVRRVLLRITGSAATGVSAATTTDDQGRFVFRDLPAARYNISATRPGYVSGTYGQSRPGVGQGAPAAIADGQHLAGLRIQIGRGAVITGRVVDEFGQPLDRAQVSVMQFRNVNGERTLAPASGVGLLGGQADDRGVYRLYGLPAGEYVVAVAGRNTGSDLRRVTEAELAWADRPPGQPAPPRGPTVGAATTYYPGTADPAAAVVIRVNAGEERSGIDFVAGLVRTATVSGRVEMPDGTPPRTVQMTVFNEARVSTPFFVGTLFARTNPDGTFSSANVPPGTYSLIARAAAATPSGAPAPPAPGGRPSPPAMTLWAIHEVTVTGEDITGLSLRLAPGMTISGRLTFDGSRETAPTNFGGYSVRAFSAATTGVSVGVPAATVKPDGTFVIEGLTPGSYRMSVMMPTRTGPLPTWTVRHIMHEGKDISETAFDVRPGVDVTGLNAVLTDRVTEVTGHVLDQQGRAVTDYSVVLLPVDEEFWRTGTRRRPAPQRPDTTGRFRLIDLPAGEYYLALVTEFQPEQLSDTTFLQSLIPSAIKFTLAEGEHKVQDVKLAGGGL